MLDYLLMVRLARILIGRHGIVAAWLLVAAATFGFDGVVQLARGQSLDFDLAIIFFFMGGVSLHLTLLYGRDQVRTKLREPLASRLTQALEDAGLSDVDIYLAPLETAEAPTPSSTGLIVFVPRRVIEDYSAPAIVWRVTTDTWILRKIVNVGLPTSLFLILCGVVASLASAYIVVHLLSGLLVAVGVGVLIASGPHFERMADRLFTVSQQDRDAAKEALSYAFYASSGSGVCGRARRLGIELERGFRAEEPPAPKTT